MKRPTIKTPCIADRYAAPCERIAEFSAPNGKGGLIAVRQCADGSVVVDVYRCDPGVRVIVNTRESVIQADDSEPIHPGDYRYYREPGAADR